MQRQAVDSSLIFAMAYDPTTQVLEVEFHRSKKQNVNPVFTYAPLSPERWAALKAEEATLNGSLGVHFLQKIKTDPTLTVTKISVESEPA